MRHILRILTTMTAGALTLLPVVDCLARDPRESQGSTGSRKASAKLVRTVSIPTNRRSPKTEKKGLLLRRQVEYLGSEAVAVVSTWRFEEGPFRTLEAILVEAQSGKPLKSLTLTSSMQSKFRYEVFPLYDGGFVFWSGDKLTRYSPQGEAIRELELLGWKHSEFNTLASWHVRDTPGGRVLRLSYGSVEDNQTKCVWRDVDTFEETFSSTAQDCSQIRLGEEIVPTQTGFQVSDKEKQVIFGGELHNGSYGGMVSKFSMNRNRFVILDAKSAIPLIQKRDYFDWRFYAKVFDMDCRCQVAEISLGTQTATVTDVALSPDGSELAAVTDGKLRLFKLP